LGIFGFGSSVAEKPINQITTGEVGGNKIPENTVEITEDKTAAKSEIKPTGNFLGKLLGKKDPNISSEPETQKLASTAQTNSTEESSKQIATETAKETESPKLQVLSWEELPKNLQDSLKFLKKENQAKIQAVEIPSEDPNVKNYQLMFTGEAAKQLFLNSFEKILHTANLFGKSEIPDQADKLLNESGREKNYLAKSLKEDRLYLQTQFAVPAEPKEKAKIMDISVTESPWNLKTLLSEREDLRKAVLNASKQLLKEKPDISFKEDLEKLNAALETKDKKQMQAALKEVTEPFARTYSLETLKVNKGLDLETGLKDASLALSSQAATKDGLNGTIVLKGADESGIIPGSVAVKDISLAGKDGKYSDSALTVIPADKETNIAKLIFYILPTMTDFAQSGKKLGNEGVKSLTEAMVKSTLNAEAQFNASKTPLAA